MAFKFVVFAGVFAIACAGNYPTSHVTIIRPSEQHVHHQPREYSPIVENHLDNYEHQYNSHPKYSFSYDVHDSHTGDIKSQHETRDGDVVKGSYSFIEADGTKRIVEYTADSHSGFNAVVHKQPATTVSYTTVTPIAYKDYSAPVAYPYPYHH